VLHRLHRLHILSRSYMKEKNHLAEITYFTLIFFLLFYGTQSYHKKKMRWIADLFWVAMAFG
jgi:hypothetical protein